MLGVSSSRCAEPSVEDRAVEPFAPAAVLVRCRSCGGRLATSFVDLGELPLANRLLSASDLGRPEPAFRLHVKVCDDCLLAQHDAAVAPSDLFESYVYFSSMSRLWVEHAKRFARQARQRFGLNQDSLVVEIASNDGYLLRHFRDMDIPVIGIDPARNVAAVARAAGIPTLIRFFDFEMARDMRRQGRSADLIVANNVLAHVPMIDDLMQGVSLLLKPGGVFTAEIPHVLELIRNVAFDTIYHEHFFYYSLHSLERIVARAGLRIVDALRLPTHGGSLRITCRHAAAAPVETAASVLDVRRSECDAGLHDRATYAAFAEQAAAARDALRACLFEIRSTGQTIAGFGAAAKGAMLLNVCGIGRETISYIADATPAKIGRFMPGVHLPIVPVDMIARTRPDFVLILPWNHRAEIIDQLACIRDWGGRFIVPVPAPEIVP